MLARFEVENFKCFQDKMILDLSQVAKYNFNSNLTVNGLVKNAVIFGKNGSGKTNIGKAIMDIVNHLTDGKRKTIGRNIPFINLDSNKRYASFLYEFHFEEGIIIYSYEKDDRQLLVSEKVIIDGQVVLDYDHTRKTGKVLIKGTENLNIDSMPDGLSLVKYAYTNSGNNTDKTRVLLDKMIDFVNRMLMFYSLGNTEYFGATDGLEDFQDYIVRSGNLNDFSQFMKRMGFDYNLDSIMVNGQYRILNRFQNGSAELDLLNSSGARSLMLLYYWLKKIENASFVFIDEFDAFYHYELSRDVMNEAINAIKGQVLFTSHNTNLMDNKYSRPDCLFVIHKNGISSLNNLTEKELREAHNLSKMYKAGAFDE